MTNNQNLTDVDWNKLPIPQDDGAAAHLKGLQLPSVTLMATNGEKIDLHALKGQTVLYIYPLTGTPGSRLPEGWDMIPGARGCTPQSCAFRDHHQELKTLGIENLFGLSTQSTTDQMEAANRLHLPFSLLSDENLKFRDSLNLPAFEANNQTLLKRLTLIISNGVINHVFYPVFPPDQNAQKVIDYLKN